VLADNEHIRLVQAFVFGLSVSPINLANTSNNSHYLAAHALYPNQHHPQKKALPKQ